MEQEYYSSKHFTAEQIDQRLLQGTYDDAVDSGYKGTREEFNRQVATMVSSSGHSIGDQEVDNAYTQVINEAIRKVPQTLTESEKAQARTNIGAINQNDIRDGNFLNAGSITKSKIADDAVTGSKIKDGTIDFDKLSPATQKRIEFIEDGSGINDGSITKEKLSTNLQGKVDLIDELDSITNSHSETIGEHTTQIESIQEDKFPKSSIVQETGDSADLVMSQKAVSERFAGMPSHDNDYSNEQWPWVPGSVSPDGKIRTYSGGENWMRTDYLRVDGINSIHAHVYFVNKYVAPIAFYDTDKNFISSHLVPVVDSNEAIESIDVPDNAQYVVFTSQQSRVSEFRFNYGLSVAVLANRNSNISNQRAIETNRKDINAQNVLLEDTRTQLQNSTTITDAPIQLTDGDILKRMQAYAYADQGVFIKNQYLDERHWFSMFKLTKGRYQIETKYVMESRTLIAGTISSESQFSIGGAIDNVIVGGGTAGDIVAFDVADETLLVLLGKEGNAFAYAEVAEIPVVSVKDKVIQIDEVLRKNPFNSEVLCCPDTYYAVVGHEFNLYYDGLIKAMDAGLKSPSGIYIDVQCPDLQNASTVIGIRRERMWQIDGSRLSDSYVGEHELYIAAYNENGKMLSRKECMLVVSNASQLQTEKRILCIGDSLTNNGDVVATCAKHFKDVGGVQPIFIGQRTTAGYKHEGYPGYTFNSFVTSGTSNAYFIFDILQGTTVSVGDKYSTNSSTYTVVDIRTEGQDNALRLRCTRSGSTTPNSTGTLTKVSGATASPSSIQYSAFEAETGNPFWDSASNTVNFTRYRERIGLASKFDAVIIMLGTNDCISDVRDMTSSVTKAKTLINAILSDAGTYPTKIILQMTPADANTISSWQVYSDQSYSRKIGYWNNMWNLRKLMYEEFTKDEWKGKVFLGQAALGVDRYYGYPYKEVESSQRISSIKEIYHTNSVHPNSEGYKQLGDGYYLQLQGLLIP